MGPETIHFLEACILDRPVHGRAGARPHGDGDSICAADLSAEINEPVDLPLSNQAIAAIADLKGGKLEKVG